MAKNKIKADRAKIFLPFDALKGFREALKEKEKIIVPKIELSEEETDKLSRLLLGIKKRMIVRVIYFNSGEYLELTGMVSNNDFVYKKITIIETVIKYIDILKIEIFEEIKENY